MTPITGVIPYAAIYLCAYALSLCVRGDLGSVYRSLRCLPSQEAGDLTRLHRE